MSPIRLTLFAPNLYGGGAERTLARLATHWAKDGHEVTLITLAAVSADDFPLPPAVRRVGLGMTDVSGGILSAVWNNARRVRAIRAAIRVARPSVVISFIEQANVLALLAARGLMTDDTDGATWPVPLPVVIAERTDPAHHPVSRLWSFLRRRTYPACIALVVLTDEIAASMQRLVRGKPVIVVPNGIAAPGPCESETAKDGVGERVLIAVGRLDHAKGFDRLIEAFASIADRQPAWKLQIIGDGPQRELLRSQISALGLDDRIQLVGRVRDASRMLEQALLFVLPSRYEGFPNALLEAMAVGLPAVAFDGPAAVRQIVRHGRDGLLVPDGSVTALAAAFEDLMTDEIRRTAMGLAACEVVTRFSEASFFHRWDQVLEAAIKRDFSPLSERSCE